MGKISDQILVSAKIRHLSLTARWIWVVFNLLVSDSSGMLCTTTGQPYSFDDLTNFVMIDKETLLNGMNELTSFCMIDWTDKCVRILWTEHEARIYKRKLMARKRKAKQRQKEKDRRNTNA